MISKCARLEARLASRCFAAGLVFGNGARAQIEPARAAVTLTVTYPPLLALCGAHLGAHAIFLSYKDKAVPATARSGGLSNAPERRACGYTEYLAQVLTTSTGPGNRSFSEKNVENPDLNIKIFCGLLSRKIM